MNGYERVLAGIEGREVDRLPVIPITMMFAADTLGVSYDRYASDYRTLVEAQLMVAQRYDFDHVSAISDPAREAADCGAAVHFCDDQPPALDEQSSCLTQRSALASLQIPDPLAGGRMTDRVRAIERFRETVKGQRWIEGWVEGPCAEAADLRGINRLMLDFADSPQFVTDLFEFVLELALRFAKAQIDAGADIIGVGDAAASLVGPRVYRRFVYDYEKRLVDGIHAAGGRVRLHICGNTNKIQPELATLGAEIVDLDWMVSLQTARTAANQAQVRQVYSGNIDPVRVVRNGTPQGIIAALERCYDEAERRDYFVAAGCEIPRDTKEENVHAIVAFSKEARTLSPKPL